MDNDDHCCSWLLLHACLPVSLSVFFLFSFCFSVELMSFIFLVVLPAQNHREPSAVQCFSKSIVKTTMKLIILLLLLLLLILFAMNASLALVQTEDLINVKR